jgi:cytochrome P450
MKSSDATPVVNVSFYEDGFNQDPFPVLEEIRRAGPIVYNELLDRWMVTSYPHASRVLGDSGHYAQGASEAFIDFFGGTTMETIDEPERHNLMRGIWAGDFQRGSLESRRELIERVVAAQLDPFVDRLRSGETVDAVADFTRSIPTLVIASMLGIELAMFEQFSAWSDAMGAIPEGALDPTERGMETVMAGRQATSELNSYIAEQVADRRRHSTDDLIGKMVDAPFARTEMSESEIIASNTQLVFAGNETTAKLMAHTLVALARHPEQRRKLAEDRSLILPAIEEVHRCQTITQFIDRDVRAEVELAGVLLAPGSVVMPLMGAANRDPERWDDASAFDVTRPGRQHLGFGFGLHSCIGLNLARMEVQVWLDRLLDVMPEYHLAQVVDYGPNFQLRGPSAVYLAA